jgi:hypothetical protein
MVERVDYDCPREPCSDACMDASIIPYSIGWGRACPCAKAASWAYIIGIILTRAYSISYIFSRVFLSFHFLRKQKYLSNITN